MYRVLLVDDNPQIRTALRWFFEELDLQCDEADNGLHALQMAQRVKPDLVILDYSMPVMNGIDAALIFKQIMPEVPLPHADGALRRCGRIRKEGWRNRNLFER